MSMKNPCLAYELVVGCGGIGVAAMLFANTTAEEAIAIVPINSLGKIFIMGEPRFC
jgi:Zn-dependent alcohol dehydrogenase